MNRTALVCIHMHSVHRLLRVQNTERSKVNGQKLAWSMVKPYRRRGPVKVRPAVAAVTIESMGVTPPGLKHRLLAVCGNSTNVFETSLISRLPRMPNV